MRAVFFTLIYSFLLFALVHSRSLQNQPVCGIPGIPLGGQYMPKKSSYKFNDKIQYSCHEFHEKISYSGQSRWLKGDETRRCLRNGTWSGSVPVCLLNGTDRVSDVKGYYDHSQNSKVMDLCKSPTKIQKCTRKFVCNKLHVFVRFKNGSLTLDGFEMTFLMSKPPDFQASSEHNSLRTCCNVSDVTQVLTNTTTVRLNCNSLRPSTGILLVFLPKKSDEFVRLCHITPLYFHPMKFGCNLPDIPLNGLAQQKFNGTRKGFDFHCEDDFDLQGPHQSTDCNPNGTWSESSPICIRKTGVEHRINDTDEDPLCAKDSHILAYVIGALAGAGVIIILAVLIVIVYACKRKSKVKVVKRLHHSSQRSDSFDISYRRNRSDEGASNRHSTGTVFHLNPDFGQKTDERPRSDVPDILIENRVLNKVTDQTKRAAIPSSHIYSDPIYSEADDERGQSGVMMDNVIYN